MHNPAKLIILGCDQRHVISFRRPVFHHLRDFSFIRIPRRCRGVVGRGDKPILFPLYPVSQLNIIAASEKS